MTHQLGRRTPSDWKHVDKYPISALRTEEIPKKVPVTIGVNWYTDFDKPVKKSGYWWIGLDSKNLGTLRGGHCVALKPPSLVDPVSWWIYYNQVKEGKCVGEGCSRMMSLLNRKRYDPTWLWNEAKMIDEWADTNPGDNNGTSVRAACDVLRDQGHRRVIGSTTSPAAVQEGISANRWAATVEEVTTALGTNYQFVTILNSWGENYPHYVRMPLETLGRLLNEYGEMTIVTDR